MEGYKKLTKKELWILSFLRKNARQHLTKIGKKTNIPISTIHDKIQKGRYMGVIKKFTALVDFSKLGYGARTVITFKVKKGQKTALFEYLMKQESINSLYRINNGFDFMVDVVFEGIKELEIFLERIENKFEIEEKNVYYIIEDVKGEAFLSEPDVFRAEDGGEQDKNI